VLVAEGLQTVAELAQDLGLRADDDAEAVLAEEALRRERQTVLVVK
jgi:ribosome assembly protein YihI (activator of Der GTPase)